MPERYADAIIFDMDGVVIDSGDVYRRQWRRWAAEHGLDYALIAPVHPGRPPVETIRLVAPELDAAEEAARYNAALERDADASEATAMPGAVELLTGLPSERWTIATSAVRTMATRWLRAVGIPVPAALVTVEDVTRGKPAPDPYLRAAARLGVSPSRCIVVEDAPAGISAARAAGATVLAVRTTHEAHELSEADDVMASLEDVSVVEAGGGSLLASWRSLEPRR